MCVPSYTLDVSCVPEKVLPNISEDPIIKPLVDIPFEGRVFFLYNLIDVSFLPKEYKVMVIRYFKPEMMPVLENVSGIVTAFGGVLSHGAILAREYGKGYVLVDDAPNRFFFGDYVKYHDGVLERTEAPFFTSGEPPYPTEKMYPQYLYRYTLGLVADSILLALLEKEHKLKRLFGETYALDLPPSQYYSALSNGKEVLRGKLDKTEKRVKMIEKSSLEYILFLHVLQRASFALLGTDTLKEFEKELVLEDFKTKEYFSANFIDSSPVEIVGSILEAKDHLINLLQ